MSFTSAHPALRRALAARSYHEPTPVQAAVLAEAAVARDLLVSAQTGSGKTVAFGLAMAPNLLGEAERLGSPGAPLALVVAPTRELAQQVHRELAWLYADAAARVITCVGGMDPRREQHLLAHGVHVVVGTPGRLCDHLERGALDLSRLRVVVLDEADEMLDMGFREDLERLLAAAPAERRTLMFSATIPKEIAALAKKYQRDAQRLATTSDAEGHRDIEYRVVPIVPRDRERAVVNLLRYFDAAGALVFCGTRDGVTHLAASLQERGFAVAALSGELTQRERNWALQALRDGRARVCVATDVAARGLDLPDLGLVIHADLPQNKAMLLHRSGRTGRAGKKGTSVILCPDPARRYFERMLHLAHVDAQWSGPPSAEDIRARDQEQLAKEIVALAAELSDEDRLVARTLIATHPAEELVATLVRVRRDARPAPEEVTIPPSMRGGADRRDDRREDRREDRRPGAAAPRPARSAPPSPRAARAIEEAEGAAGARAPRAAEDEATPTGGNAWFAINVGRAGNADPRWLVPLLCRRGGITKSAIGKIRILPRETHVEIAAAASARFAAGIREPDAQDRHIRIRPLASPPSGR